MNIPIQYIDKRIMCDVAYKCPHRETEIETRTDGHFEPFNDTYVETSTQVEICKNPLCEAWRYVEDVVWEDDYMVEVEG
jgi:hypothetical protein